MKDIHRLLGLLLVLFEGKEKLDGMCNSILLLEMLKSISEKEGMQLQKYLHEHEPKDAGRVYWYPVFDKEPRIKWLKKQIKLNKEL